MSSARKVKSNTPKARSSTGPKTAGGKARSATNALRHGLSLPVLSCPVFSEEVEALACEIAGADANLEIRELARQIAEAQIDLRRVRSARHDLLSSALGNSDYESRATVVGVQAGDHSSWQQFCPTWRSDSRLWIGTNGGRCRDASSRSGHSMRRGEEQLQPFARTLAVIRVINRLDRLRMIWLQAF